MLLEMNCLEKTLALRCLERIRMQNIKSELVTIRTNDKPTKYIIWVHKKETGWGERFEVPINV